MKKAVKAILNVLSYGGIEVESARRLADIKKLDPIRIFLRKLDMEIYNGDYKVRFGCSSRMKKWRSMVQKKRFCSSMAAAGQPRAWRHTTVSAHACAVDGADCCIGRIPSCTGASFPDRLRRLLRRRPGNAARGDSAGGNAGKCHDHGRQRRRKSCGCGLPDGEG